MRASKLPQGESEKRAGFGGAEPDYDVPDYPEGALAILAAAERLIGQHGLDGISIRQITLAAGMGNNSAVAYHFGDREGLLRAVSLWRLPVLAKGTQDLYDEAEGAGELDDPKTLLRILFAPTLAIIDEAGRHPHAAFMREMMRSRKGVSIRMSLYDRCSATIKAIERFREACSAVPVDLVDYRLRLASVAVFEAISARDLGLDGRGFKRFDDGEFLSEMLGMAEAICLRPAPR